MAPYEEHVFLCYEHKANGRKLVPGGVSIMSEENIVMSMSAHEEVHMVTKKIKRGQTHIDLHKIDLLQNSNKPAAIRLAEVQGKTDEVPWKVFLGFEWEHHSFDELTILTPDPSAIFNADGTLVKKKLSGQKENPNATSEAGAR